MTSKGKAIKLYREAVALRDQKQPLLVFKEKSKNPWDQIESYRRARLAFYEK